MDDHDSKITRDTLGLDARASVSRGGKPTVESDWVRWVRIGDVHFGADNLGSALEYYDRALSHLSERADEDAQRVDVEIRVADSLRRLGKYRDSAAFVRASLDREPLGRSPLLHAKLLSRLGAAEICLTEYQIAREHCREAHGILRQTDAHAELAFLDFSLGVIAHRLGEVDAARLGYENALVTYRRIDDSDGIARTLENLGVLLKNGPRWMEAKDHLTRALAVSEAAGNYARVASHCLNLGILYTKAGEWTLAADHLTRALSIFKETDASWGATKSRLALGNLALRRRQLALAESHYRHALEGAQERGLQREIALSHEFLGDLALARDDLEGAEKSLDEAMAVAFGRAPEGDMVGEILGRQARLALRNGEPEKARELATRSLEIARRIGDDVELGSALAILGRAKAEVGELGEAESLVLEAKRVLAAAPDVLERITARRAWVSILIHKAARATQPAERREHRTEIASRLERIAADYLELELPESSVLTLAELAQVFADLGDLDEALVTASRALEAAERHSIPHVRQKLETLRADLEELCAESVLTQSAEFQLMEDVVGFSPSENGSTVEAYLRLACEKSRSDRAILAAETDARPHVLTSVGFEDGAADRTNLLRVIHQEFREGRRVHVANDPEVDGRYANLSGQDELGAVVAIPLIASDSRLGILLLERGPANAAGPFRNADLRLLSFFSGILSVYLTTHHTATKVPDAGPAPDDAFAEFVSCSSEIKRSVSLLRKLGASDAGVLITGETGTGKGLLARVIHKASGRSDGPFVPVNCAALPETLLESELFGHEQGAFTGAVRRKTGLFEEAAGGALFLDEVDKAPISVQAKLLHVLDKHEIRRVGSTRWKPVDVRVICATNADLLEAIENREFLEDLYYRLNDFQVRIPPLRERREDIPLLVRHFYDQFASTDGERPLISREVMQALTDHDWRGNVRELEKVVKRILVLAEPGEVIRLDLLPPEILEKSRSSRVRPGSGTLREEIQRLEAQLIGDALTAAGGNKSEVARRLKISYPSLLSKIRQYKLEPAKRNSR